MPDKQPSLSDALQQRNPGDTGKTCTAARRIEALSPDNRELYDAWVSDRDGNRNSVMPIRSMAESVSAVTGERVTSSSLGLHIAHRCCCYV